MSTGNVKLQQWFAEGYQQALIDIANALDTGGATKARDWIDANATMTTRDKITIRDLRDENEELRAENSRLSEGN